MSDPDDVLRHDSMTFVRGEDRDGRPVPVPYFVGEMPAPPDSLDAAWAEAEAALPDGWTLLEVSRLDRDEDGGRMLDARGGYWYASAGEGNKAQVVSYIRREETETGHTPAAALRGLAAKLRERGA